MAFRSVRRRMSIVAVSAALAVSAFGVATSGAAIGASPTATVALPVVKVSPTTGLVDLQNVTVTGSGFSDNVQIGTVECRAGATGEGDCDLGTLVYVQSDQHGKFTLTRYVRRLISVGGKTIDCGAAKGCILGAGNVANLKQASGQTIFFNPKIPPKVAKITVSPNTKLADHQLVTVSGKGFAPSTTVSLSQCVTHPAAARGQVCDYATARSVSVETNGTFTASNFVLERRQVTFTIKNTQSLLDCAAKPDTCDIQANASGLGPSTPVDAPLTFGLYIKPAVAAVQLSPSSPLDDLEAVTLTGTGFTPGYAVTVQECAVGTASTPSCDFTTVRTVTAGFTGAFTLAYTVRRDITSVATTGATIVDCATNACELTVQGTQSQPTTDLPLTFDPNVPAVSPTITAIPNTGLSDNQNIAVSVSGFTPNQPVQIIECSADAITEGDNLGYCDYTTGQTVTPTGPSALQTSFVVRASLGGQAGLVDCTSQPGACVLVATDDGGYYGGPIITPGSALPDLASTPLAFMTS